MGDEADGVVDHWAARGRGIGRAADGGAVRGGKGGGGRARMMSRLS